jgi:mono/diheme cytochrome c family protein
MIGAFIISRCHLEQHSKPAASAARFETAASLIHAWQKIFVAARIRSSPIPSLARPCGSRRHLPWIALLLITALPSARAQDTPDYTDVAPILQQRCVMCHSGAAPAAGLRLDSLQALLEGSAGGKVVIAGAPQDSELLRRIRGDSQPRMPMTGPPFLSDAEIETIEQWIAGGLQTGETGAAKASPAAQPARPAAGERVTYLHVAPIFAIRCAKCHTDNGLMGPAPEGYRLTSHQATLARGERVRVVPGNPAASELLRRIRGQSRERMPLDGPPYLDAEEIRLIEDWIAQGAADAEGSPAPVPTGARVRLQGRLTAANRLDDLELVIGAHTRIDKNPRPGDYVQLRGRIDSAGRVIVERLRKRKK